MKSKLSTLLLSLCFTGLSLANEGAGGGNGGGGFCYDTGKCVTLAEAGLRIPREGIQLFMISQELEAEVKRLLSFLPVDDRYIADHTRRAVGERNTFVKIEQESARKFKKVIQDYRDLIKQNAPRLASKKFVLYAVSEETKEQTYLLPTFFDLPLTEQALILIHEANVRNRPSSIIPTAIQYDGLLDDFINRPASASTLEFYLVNYDLFIARNYSEETAQYDLFTRLATYFSKKIGRNLRMSDFCEEPLYYGCQVRREKAFQGNQTIDPSFAKLFYGMEIVDQTILGVNGIDPGAFFSKDQLDKLCEGVMPNDQVLAFSEHSNFHSGHAIFAVECEALNGRIIPTKAHNVKVQGIVTR